MHLSQLRAENFRLFESLSLQPHCRLNLVLGDNAAGKTSLLEAVYCLTRAKSFRSTSPGEIAGKAGRRWGVAGEFVEGDVQLPGRSVQVVWDADGTQVKVDRNPAGTLEVVKSFPAQIMEPGMHRLLQEGPGYRRSFLDWGVFHVEQQFLPTWRRFQRALKQRNHALRRNAPAREVSAWDPELAESAAALQTMRAAHVEQIRGKLGPYIERLLGIAEWQLDLSRGWAADTDYREVLTREAERDRRQGMTVEGPHRAELRIRLEDHQVKNRISRGQQKLLICALILAQAELIRASLGHAPVLLVDDFGAELAPQFQASLFGELLSYPGQVFLTAFGRDGALAREFEGAMFHVEHGRATAV